MSILFDVNQADELLSRPKFAKFSYDYYYNRIGQMVSRRLRNVDYTTDRLDVRFVDRINTDVSGVWRCDWLSTKVLELPDNKLPVSVKELISAAIASACDYVWFDETQWEVGDDDSETKEEEVVDDDDEDDDDDEIRALYISSRLPCVFETPKACVKVENASGDTIRLISAALCVQYPQAHFAGVMRNTANSNADLNLNTIDDKLSEWRVTKTHFNEKRHKFVFAFLITATPHRTTKKAKKIVKQITKATKSKMQNLRNELLDMKVFAIDSAKSGGTVYDYHVRTFAADIDDGVGYVFDAFDTYSSDENVYQSHFEAFCQSYEVDPTLQRTKHAQFQANYTMTCGYHSLFTAELFVRGEKLKNMSAEMYTQKYDEFIKKVRKKTSKAIKRVWPDVDGMFVVSYDDRVELARVLLNKE
jgi:hypothetical protein